MQDKEVPDTDTQDQIPLMESKSSYEKDNDDLHTDVEVTLLCFLA